MFDCEWERREPPAWLAEPGHVSVFDAVTTPANAAEALAITPPGPAATAALAAVEVSRLDPTGHVDLLCAVERQIAWLQSLQQRVLAVIEEDTASGTRVGDQLRRNFAREQVGCALRLAGITAEARLATALSLRDRFPRTLRQLESGEISYWHAKCLVEATVVLADPVAAVVEEAVSARAPELTVGEFRAAVRRAVIAADPASAEQRHQRALADRDVRATPGEDGMTGLWALLPTEGAAAVLAALDTLAAVSSADDPRTLRQRRADALVDLGGAALHDPALPRAHGLRPHIQVTVALPTLLGMDEQPGDLAGYGAITAAAARRIAADSTGTWRRLVTDPVTSRLLDYGRRTYRPPADLARFVITQDPTCVFPGCCRPAHRCDLDHLVPFPDGPTSEANLAPECRRHHAAKHEGGWRIAHDLDGGYTWTSPTGHRYRSSTPPMPWELPPATAATAAPEPESGADPPPF